MDADPLHGGNTRGVASTPTNLAPPVPANLADTGLSQAFVLDLLTKVLYERGARSGNALSDHLCLPFAILDELLMGLQKRHLVEVRGAEGHGRRAYVFDLTNEGRNRARELLETNAYAGPAPVPSATYREWVKRQSARQEPVPRTRMHQGLDHLVLDEGFVDQLGPGINSGRSVFLYGPPGNGKTEIAFAVGDILGGHVHVPHAVLIGGQVVRVYDPNLHEPPDEGTSDGMSVEELDVDPDLLEDVPDHDPRFVRSRRPSVVVGGELTLDDLELKRSESRGVLEAPPQMKANGGVFVLDDFGRQHVRPRDLLNRWMIPLDRGMDYLGLPTGHKLEIPFDCLVFFATNLDPTELVEEAFLRRIRYKVRVPDPTREDFAEIMRRVCEAKGVRYDQSAVDRVFRDYYEGMGIPPRACHPGDLVAAVHDRARYLDVEPALEGDLLADACRSYFIDISRSEGLRDPGSKEGHRRGP